MKIADLHRAVKITSRISNNNSMSDLFKCCELSSEAVRAVSEYGNLEFWIQLPEIVSPILVNTAALAAVINSLPSEGDLKLTQLPDRLNWRCGAASGHLSFPVVRQAIPVIPSNKNFSWKSSKDFPEALELATTACQSMTVSIGLFGVVLEPMENYLRMTSSNNNSLATTKVALEGYPTKDTITLRPPVPQILSAILKSEPEALVDIGKDGIFILSPTLIAHLPISSPLEHSLGPVISRFQTEVDSVKINSKAIDTFLSRAKALSEKSVAPEVNLQIVDGKILLKQSGGAASSEEYFLAEGLSSDKTFNSVTIPLALLVPSLEHIEIAILDFLQQNILVLKGSKPDFRHVIGGKAKS